jgi:hypothetical protein
MHEYKEPPKITIIVPFKRPMKSLMQWIEAYCAELMIPVEYWYADQGVRDDFWEWMLKDDSEPKEYPR